MQTKTATTATIVTVLDAAVVPPASSTAIVVVVAAAADCNAASYTVCASRMVPFRSAQLGLGAAVLGVVRMGAAVTGARHPACCTAATALSRSDLAWMTAATRLSPRGVAHPLQLEPGAPVVASEVVSVVSGAALQSNEHAFTWQHAPFAAILLMGFARGHGRS